MSDENRYENIGKVLFISLIFLGYLSAVNSAVGIVSLIFKQKGYNFLGNLSVLQIFIGSSISNLISAGYVKQWSFKLLLWLCSFSYILFISGGILVCSCDSQDSYFYCPSLIMYSIISVLSLICGWFSTILFIIEIQYVSQCSNSDNQGLFFGISMGLLNTSFLVGNFYSSFLVKPYGQRNYFIIMDAVAIVFAFLFLFLRQPKPKTHQSSHPQIKVENDKQIISEQPNPTITDVKESEAEKSFENKQSAEIQNQLNLEKRELEFLNDLIKEQQLSDINTQINLIRDIQIMFKIMSLKQTRPFLLYLVNSGVILSFIFSFYSRLVQASVSDESHEEIDKQTFQGNILLGLMEFVGGVFITQTGDRFAQKDLAILSNNLQKLAIIFSILCYYLKNYPLAVATAGLWGFTDCLTQSLNQALLSQNFGDNVRIFGLYNFMQCMGAVVGLLFSIVFIDASLMYLLGIMIVVQIATRISLKFVPSKSSSDLLSPSSIQTHDKELSMQQI